MANLILKNNTSGGITSITADEFIGKANLSDYVKLQNGNEFNLYGNNDNTTGDIYINYREGSTGVNATNKIDRYIFGNGQQDSNTILQAAFFTGNSATATDADKLDGKHAYQFVISGDTYDSNLNSCVTSGVYHLTGSNTNAPSNYNWSQFFVLHGGGDTIAQMVFPYNGGAASWRAGNPSEVSGGGSWGNWRYFLDSSNYNSYAPSLTGVGASGTWGINISGKAAMIDTRRTISGSSHADALRNEFNNNKNSIPRNLLLTYYSEASGNGSLCMGYFIPGYNDAPYGGFYVAHYNTPWYVGVQYGEFNQQEILTSSSYNQYAPTKSGGGASGTWNIDINGVSQFVSLRHSNELNFYNNDQSVIWFNYRSPNTGNNTTTKISHYHFGNGQHGYTDTTIWAGYFRGNAIIVSSWGSTFPSSAVAGQVFFKT